MWQYISYLLLYTTLCQNLALKQETLISQNFWGIQNPGVALLCGSNSGSFTTFQPRCWLGLQSSWSFLCFQFQLISYWPIPILCSTFPTIIFTQRNNYSRIVNIFSKAIGINSRKGQQDLGLKSSSDINTTLIMVANVSWVPHCPSEQILLPCMLHSANGRQDNLIRQDDAK